MYVFVAHETNYAKYLLSDKLTRELLSHCKCTDFWRGKIEADECEQCQLWRIVDSLLGRGRIPARHAVDV